eukprot:scaffold173421_cov29-Tisochrysis_lutea.AAC.1
MFHALHSGLSAGRMGAPGPSGRAEAGGVSFERAHHSAIARPARPRASLVAKVKYFRAPKINGFLDPRHLSSP